MINPVPILLLAMAAVLGGLLAGHRGAAIGFLVMGALILAADAANRPRFGV